jgi:hypothetical protein
LLWTHAVAAAKAGAAETMQRQASSARAKRQVASRNEARGNRRMREFVMAGTYSWAVGLASYHTFVLIISP